MPAPSFYFPVPGTPSGPGYELSFFEAGSSTPAAVYHTSGLGLPWAQPIVFNAAGVPDGQIFCDPDQTLKVVYVDADGVAVSGYPYDFYSPPIVET